MKHICLTPHSFFCVFCGFFLQRERERASAFIFVYSDSTSVDSDCKTHVHSVLKTVNFFQCISLEKLPKKDRKVQTEYV
jgi:hypothetical protein